MDKHYKMELHFDISNFPITYRLGILSYIKDKVRRSSEEFYHEFFIENEKETKPFTFSTYFTNFKMKDKTIEADDLRVLISTSSEKLVFQLISGIDNKVFNYKEAKIKLKDFKIHPMGKINNDKVWFTTCSPIFLSSKDEKPMMFDNPYFEKTLNIITNKIMQSNISRQLYKPLQILYNNLNLQVVKENFHMPNNSILHFNVNKGDFILGGDPRDLDYIYTNGLGLKTGVGFGMLELQRAR